MQGSLHTGLLPNVYYQALSMEQLRQRPEFHALPPTETICLVGRESFQYVRQDDALWKRLHGGVLTSGFLASALGFFEPSAARILKIGRNRTSHAHLMSVYHHLCQPPYVPDFNSHVTNAEAHNRNRHVAFNQASGTGNGTVDLCTQGEYFAKATLAVPEEFKLKRVRSLSQEGLLAVRCAWGKVQEASTLLEAARLFPSSKLYEVGLCMLNVDDLPADWGLSADSLPSIGASPDALFLHPVADQSCNNNFTTPNSDGIEANQEVGKVGHLLERLRFDESKPSSENDPNRFQSRMLGTNGYWEPLEVKNSCPFTYANARKGGIRKFVLCDGGPRNKIEPTWVPQLQLQMLCSGTQSILLVSRSISRGLNIFRLRRDDEYVRLMLTVVSQFYTKHVLPRRPPATDAFAKSAQHQKLLSLTKKLATTGTVVSVDAAQVDCCYLEDERFFLD